jgi:hypothetical protein
MTKNIATNMIRARLSASQSSTMLSYRDLEVDDRAADRQIDVGPRRPTEEEDDHNA